MPDEPDPPRKVYGFKEREFKRDNAVGGDATPSAKDLARMAGPVTRSGPEKTGAKPTDPNDVFKVLEQNRSVEKAHHRDDIEIRKVRSRRKRDFWLILVGGNLAIIGGVYFSGVSVITLVFGLAGLVIFSIGLSWIMWQVMDRY